MDRFETFKVLKELMELIDIFYKELGEEIEFGKFNILFYNPLFFLDFLLLFFYVKIVKEF